MEQDGQIRGAYRDPLVHQGAPAELAHPVLRVNLDLLVILDHRVNRAQQDIRVQRVLRVLPVRRVRMVCLDRLGNRVQQDIQVVRVQRVH
jgi:hypothetical protein